MILRYKRFCAYIVALLTLGTHVGTAQPPSEQVKDFFEKDYASRSPQGAARSRDLPTNSLAQSGVQAPAQRGNTHDAQKQKDKMLVTVLVNSLNRQHLIEVVEGALKLHDQKLAVVTMIEHVGDYRNFTPELQVACDRRGIVVVESPAVPIGLEYDASPLWSILTPAGRHIVQGSLSVDRYFNAWGEYDPKLAKESLNGGTLEKL